MQSATTSLHTVLREQFDLEAFRPGQEAIIQALLDGRDVLGLMPTGSGKSLTYQLTAQLLPGITLVVSPLIALMQDQVESLHARSVGVSVINSTQSARAARGALTAIKQGAHKLLYVTPERFENQAFVDQLKDVQVSLFVVDEAHCISDWGHSFRPAYLELPNAIAVVKRPPVLALTATATPWVREEIVQRLGLRDPLIVAHGFDRPNLFWEQRRVEQEADDRRVLHELLTPPSTPPDDETPLQRDLRTLMQGSGIIYTSTTAAARETAKWLRDWGIRADYYHGQRKKADRERVQQAFMSGEIRVIVATNAFGLGVDKPDVRFVIHRDVPGSLEAYYQEAGRAGRDGELARCTLIFRSGDLSRSAFLAGGGQLTREEVVQAHAGLVAQTETTIAELERATGLGRADLDRLLAILKRARIVRERRGTIRMLKPDFDPQTISLEDEERRMAYERSRRDMLRAYAETNACRRKFMLNYFGEDYGQEQCGLCDNDAPANDEALRVVVTETQAVDAAFNMGERVRHATLGEGVVQGIAADSITVLFDDTGFKTLATEIVQEQGLLEKAD